MHIHARVRMGHENGCKAGTSLLCIHSLVHRSTHTHTTIPQKRLIRFQKRPIEWTIHHIYPSTYPSTKIHTSRLYGHAVPPRTYAQRNAHETPRPRTACEVCRLPVFLYLYLILVSCSITDTFLQPKTPAGGRVSPTSTTAASMRGPIVTLRWTFS
jgi:hypothetical protein